MKRIRTPRIAILFSICIILSGPVFSQERDLFDMVLTSEEKADLEDVISTSQDISKESQAKLKEALERWERLEKNIDRLPKPVQDKIREINRAGFKNKIKAFQNQFKNFDDGLSDLLDKKEKIDQVIYFYDRYRPDSQNPFRSLEVLENAFTDVESLLPEEQEYEYFRNTSVWLIRTGIRYFRTAIQNALGGLRNIQKQIKDRAGNCIGFVGGDATADSNDPKRKAFTDLRNGETVCYTGIRPVGGELWSNETGTENFIWYSGKWTRLNCGLGDANEIFDYWMLANGSAISAGDMILWCTDANRLLLYKNARSWAESEFNKLMSVNDCQKQLLQYRNRTTDLDQLLNSVQKNKDIFLAKYIFQKDGIREQTKLITDIISKNILFYGEIKNADGNIISNTEITIKTIFDERSVTTQNGRFEMLMEIPEGEQNNLPFEIIATAQNFKDYNSTSRTYDNKQCYDLGILKLENNSQLFIQPATSSIEIGESVDFTVTYSDGESQIDVTSIALNNSTFTGLIEGTFSVMATYNNLSAIAEVEVVAFECGPNEIWDATRNECICETGYERDSLGICVEISENEPEEITCPDPNSEMVWDDIQQKYVCNCKENYITDTETGLCVKDVNAILSQSDCAADPYATASWDPVNEVVICNCNDYYKWDDAQKKCIPDIQAILNNSDCSQYPNTQPVWDYSSNEPICDCKPGFVWNEDGTGCVEGQALQVANSDCSGYFNSRPVWDEDAEMVICDCLPGYVWNDEGTGCIPDWEDALADADCSAYPNTEPVWDPVGKETYCDCIPGYQWADDNLHCEKITTEQFENEDCSLYPNTEAVYDPASNQYYCDCIPGYKWNNNRTGCVPERKKPNFDWNGLLTATMDILNAANGSSTYTGTSSTGSMVGTQTQQPVVHQSNCNDKQEAGGDAPEVHNINLGQSFGTFVFDYETFDVKDQIIVTQGGQTIFNTGCVGADGSVPLNLNGSSSTITVRVNPNCDGTSGTSWNFTVHCP